MTCSFSGVIFGQEQTGTPMTFDQAMQYMQTNSHVLKQASFQVNEKEATKKATMGLRAPKIGLTGTAVQMSDPLHLDLTPVRDAITPLYSALGHYGNFSGVPNPDPATSGAMPVLPDSYSTQAVRASLLEGLEKINAAEWDQMIQEKQFASLSASVMWPLFTGGKINAANKASELYQEEAELQRDQKQGELLSELVTRYYGLVLARQAKQVRQQVFDAMNKHLYDAQKLSEQGQIARVEFLHAQVAQADAERELKKAAREVDILERALQNTLAMPDTISVLPASPLFMIKTIEDEGYFTQMALVNNPLLKQVDS
jgi:outer membrane protein TolC